MDGPEQKGRKIGRIVPFLKDNLHLALPLAASILTLCSTYILLGPVLNRSGDNMYHVLNEFALRNAILAGDNPFGPVPMEFGQPVLRFYQCLYYLVNVMTHLITGINLHFLHNLAVVVCFALSPFSYFYFLRKLGVNRWAAAIGSFLSMMSIAAFGNSFEAYHQAGIVTQSMGGLFFPWFMGTFIGLLRGENSASKAAALFALAFLSHAIMSVFATFTGALYFAVTRFRVAVVWRRIAIFAALGICLVSFWVFPFIAHTYEMRPIPDSIVRGKGVHWFTSVSKSELAMVLTTGRLLDDARKIGDARDADDKFMDTISIISTLKTRPPVITVLAGLGFVVALFGIRRASHRFLLSGFLFSIMLFAGPDDFRWLRFLPFMKQIQTFRCTYLIEFFAFGLGGVAVEAACRHFWIFASTRPRFLGRPLIVSLILAVAYGGFFTGNEIVLLGKRHLRTRDPDFLDAMIDAMGTLPNKGYPYRAGPVYEGRFKLRHGWFAVHGIRPYCTHWKGTGPSQAHFLCGALGSSSKNNDLHALVGVRYFSGQGEKIDPLLEAKDADGDPLLERLPNGRDRRGKSNAWHVLLDTGRDHFLRPQTGSPLAVVCTSSQWIWLTKSWTTDYRRWLWEQTTPIPMRVKGGELSNSGLMDHVDAVVYLDKSHLEADFKWLKEFSSKGGTVLSPFEIPDTNTVVIKDDKSIWKLLPTAFKRPRKANAEKDHREEMDPGFENVWVKMRLPKGRSSQYYEFDVDVLEPSVAILPMEAVPGWKADLSGSPLPAFPAGPDMLGVLLPPGANRLTFYWVMPKWHRAMAWVSYGTAFSLLGFWVLWPLWRFARKRRPGKNDFAQ